MKAAVSASPQSLAPSRMGSMRADFRAIAPVHPSASHFRELIPPMLHDLVTDSKSPSPIVGLYPM